MKYKIKVSIFRNFWFFAIEIIRYFETKFLEEADEFISKLSSKAIEKVFFNIDLAEQTKHPKLFKKLRDLFGEISYNHKYVLLGVVSKLLLSFIL